jgi:uncharacterized protein
MFQPKDFVGTDNGLLFAVVANGQEENRVMCFLRYIYRAGHWQKVNTDQANAYLRQHHPDYLFHSTFFDADLHGVPVAAISRHLQPSLRLRALIMGPAQDEIETSCQQLCLLLQEKGLDLCHMGVTGSLLAGLQHSTSDIDLVVYGRELFQRARGAVCQLLHDGVLQPLAENDWEQSYQRRDCDLTLKQYIWHEQRKFNKFMFRQRKVDLNLIERSQNDPDMVCQKLGAIRIRVQVSDAELAFDYPAIFSITHPEITSIICFTATYTGQAEAGEWVEVAGQLEQTLDGQKRIIVGSTREARGEYIRVVDAST